MTVFPVSMAVPEQVAQMELAVHPAVLVVVVLLGLVVHQGLVGRMVVMAQVESPEQMVRLVRRGQLEHLVQAVLQVAAGLLVVADLAGHMEPRAVPERMDLMGQAAQQEPPVPLGQTVVMERQEPLVLPEPPVLQVPQEHPVQVEPLEVG